MPDDKGDVYSSTGGWHLQCRCVSTLAMAVSYGSSPNRSTDMGPTTYHLCWSHTVMQMLKMQYKDMFRSTPRTCGEESGECKTAGAYEVYPP